MSPTARSLQVLRQLGYTAGIVEKWNAFAKIRIDLFGIIDIVAIKPNEILGVQATTGSNHSSHVKKALGSSNLALWRASGGRFEIWSWAKQGKRGEFKRWELRRDNLMEGL